MVQTKDGEFRVETALVRPEDEVAFCQERIKEQEKEKAKLEAKLKKDLVDRSAIMYISLENKDGEPIKFMVADEEFERMWFEVDGDNVTSFLAQAQVHLKNVLGSPKNDRERAGGLIHMCDKQIAKYRARIDRAERQLRAQGGRG